MRGLPFAAAALALAVAGCGLAPDNSALPPPKASTGQVQVQALEQEYLDQFLTPATAYALGPNHDPVVVKKLQAADKAAYAALAAAQSFTDAAPAADAAAPIASARAALTAAEAQLPGGN